MRAEIEPLSGLIRVWDTDDLNVDLHGLPFIWSAGVRFLNKKEVEIVAFHKDPKDGSPALSKEISKAIKDYCRMTGIQRVLVTRYRQDGTQYSKWIRAREPKNKEQP